MNRIRVEGVRRGKVTVSATWHETGRERGGIQGEGRGGGGGGESSRINGLFTLQSRGHPHNTEGPQIPQGGEGGKHRARTNPHGNRHQHPGGGKGTPGRGGHPVDITHPSPTLHGADQQDRPPLHRPDTPTVETGVGHGGEGEDGGMGGASLPTLRGGLVPH